MELITSKQLAIDTAKRWNTQYSEYCDTRKRILGKKLATLTNPTPEEINAIIGNASWTTPPKCGECNKQFDYIIKIGEEQDYESNTAYICRSCLVKASNL